MIAPTIQHRSGVGGQASELIGRGLGQLGQTGCVTGVRWAFAVLCAAAAVVVAAPGWFNLSMRPIFLHLVSLRGALALAGLVAAALVSVVLLVRSRLAKRRSSRSASAPPSAPSTKSASSLRPTVALLIVCLLFSAANLGVMFTRGLDPAARVDWPELAQQREGDDEITVVSLNTLWDRVPVAELVGYITSSQADVVALPEAEPAYATELSQALEQAGQPGWQVFATHSPWPNAMLVSSEMGRYEAREGSRGVVRAEPADGNGPVLLTVHAAPPPPVWPSRTKQERFYLHMWWERTVTNISAEVRAEPWVIAAGDFNSTLDHEALNFGDHLHATDGAAGWGTWPRRVWSIWGAPIDHVVVDRTHWQVSGRWVVDARRSDHRAVVVRLRPHG